MKDVHKRANDATRFQEGFLTILVLALAILGLGYLALIGDDIRASRMGVEVIDLPEYQYQHRHAPRDEHCGWSCIDRIPTEGEVWE